MSTTELVAIKLKLTRSERMIADLSAIVRSSQKQINQAEAELSTFKKKDNSVDQIQLTSDSYEILELKKIIRRQERRITNILSELTRHKEGGIETSYVKPSLSGLDSRVNTQHLVRVLENIVNEVSSMQNSRVLKSTKLLGSKLPSTSMRIMSQVEFLKKQLNYLIKQ